MKSINYIALLVLMSGVGFVNLVAQVSIDSSTVQKRDTSITIDTLTPDIPSIGFSKDTFASKVNYGADDSTVLDNTNRFIYLYGNAYLEFENYSIKGADKIEVDLEKSIAVAEQLPDSLKPPPAPPPPKAPIIQEETEELSEEEQLALELEDDPLFFDPDSAQRRIQDELNRAPEQQPIEAKNGQPEFSDGNSTFISRKLIYNFETNKGKIFDVITQESNLYVRGTETKFVSSKADSVDSDVVYNQSVLLTTCDAPVPHYGIRSRKQKIIPDRQVIVGGSNVEIANIPTPLFLPFGFFPLTSGPKNGLIFPRDYEYSEQWGFGLRDIGYYFPISEKIDLTVLGDIYFNGSWGIKANSRYKNRYKYSGTFNLGYSDRVNELANSDVGVFTQHTKSFKINWTHTQDNKAHPYRSFNASVNIQTSGYDQLNFNTAQRVLNNSYSSNISYRRSFPNSPFSLSANIRHSQNTRTNDMQFTLPDINVRMKRIFPFKRKQAVGSEKWFEKISLQYNSQLKNRIQTKDTLLFQDPFFEKADFGIDHDFNTSATFRVLKYFNLTPNANFSSTWYFQTIDKSFDPNSVVIAFDTIYNFDSTSFQVIQDTLDYGSSTRDTLQGFSTLNQFNIGVSLNTQVFFTYLAKNPNAKFKGLRWVMKPTVSFSYTPDYQDFGYIREVQEDIREDIPFDTYSIFEGGLFGSVPTTPGRQMAISYSINNIFEAKVFNKRDSTDRNLRLLNTLNISGSYNFAADTLQFSQVRLSGNTQLIDRISRLQFSATWDPYVLRNNRRINKFYWDETGKPLRFVNARVMISNALSIDQLKSLIKGDGLQSRSSGNRSRQQNQNNQLESLTDIFSAFRLSHQMVISWRMNDDGKVESDIQTNAIRTSGLIPLTKNWNLNVTSVGYDFNSKRITYPSFGLTRDLHCWTLGFNWAPQRNTYQFFIGVRQSPLDALKLPYNKNNQDTFFR